MPPYFKYKEPRPAALRNPQEPDVEHPRDWPKVFQHKSSNEVARVGIHSPGPVYTSNQPADYQWYYNQAQPVSQVVFVTRVGC